MLEVVARRCSVKMVFLSIWLNLQKNTSARVSSLKKLMAEAFNLIKKEALAQVFSCKFCESFKNTFFKRTLVVAAFEMLNSFVTEVAII